MADRKPKWRKEDRCWVKFVDGKRHYLKQAPNKSCRESYRVAVQRLNEIYKLVDAGKPVPAGMSQMLSQDSSAAPEVKVEKRSYNPRRVPTVIRKFLKEKQAIADASNGEDLTHSRVSDLRSRLAHFGDYFKDALLSQITGPELKKWSVVASSRVAEKKVAPATNRKDMQCVRQLFRWALKNDLISKLPKTLDELGHQTRVQKKKQNAAKRHLFFEPKEIKQLFEALDPVKMDPKWKNRTDQDWELLRVSMVLALNTGMTQQDLSDLKVGEVFLSKRPPRIMRQRSKTGAESNHRLWTKSVEMLKPRLNGMKHHETVFQRRDGRPLVTQTLKDGRNTGGRSDALGAAFKRLVHRVLGDDDPRRFRELRRTGADRCKQRKRGLEKMYLSHEDGEMSAFYTKPAQDEFDQLLGWIGKDFGFHEGKP